MRKSVLVLVMATLVALSGCAGLLADDSSGIDGNETVGIENEEPGATSVNQTLRVEVTESMAGSEWSAIGATYPREDFVVNSAQHENLVLGVDSDGDGEMDREFDESHVSGVNNNEYTFDVTLDTGYTLQEGDVVMVQYPAIDNPSEPGDYEVDVRVNDEQSTTGTVTIG